MAAGVVEFIIGICGAQGGRGTLDIETGGAVGLAAREFEARQGAAPIPAALELAALAAADAVTGAARRWDKVPLSALAPGGRLHRWAYGLALAAAGVALRQPAAGVVAVKSHGDTVGEWIMSLCGGRGWRGGPVALAASGATGRAARSIWARRGAIPSDSSMEAAAADAVAAVWMAARRWDKVPLSALVPGGRLYRWAFRIAWRASFNSLATAKKQGGKVRNGAQAELIPLDSAALSTERASLAAWAAGCQLSEGEAARMRADAAQAARRRMALARFLRWVRMELASGREYAALVYLASGADYPTAAKRAGFPSVEALTKAFQRAKVWARLQAGAVHHQTAAELELIQAARVAGMAAGATVKRTRAAALALTVPAPAPARVAAGCLMARRSAMLAALDARAAALVSARALARRKAAARQRRIDNWLAASKGLRTVSMRGGLAV